MRTLSLPIWKCGDSLCLSFGFGNACFPVSAFTAYVANESILDLEHSTDDAGSVEDGASLGGIERRGLPYVFSNDI